MRTAQRYRGLIGVRANDGRFGEPSLPRWRWLAALSCAASLSLAAEPDLTGYLRDHHSALHLSTDGTISGAELIDASSGKIFFLGEVHGVAINYPLDLALLRHFHARAGIRVYLSEISHAHAWWLNRFLATGDEAILDLTLAQMKGFVDGSVERRDFFRQLRAWNLTLPMPERVTVVGFDLERMPGLSLACLGNLLEGRETPSELAAVIEPLRRVLNGPPEQARPTIEAVGEDLTTHRERYAAWLGEAPAFDFTLVINNLVDRYRCMADRSQFDRLRDRVMAANFTRLSARKKFTRGYGRAGSAHVLQRITGEVDHVSSLLNRAGALGPGSVVGIWPLYAESRHLSFNQGQPCSTPCTDDQGALAPFVTASEGELTLFKLDASGSPFRSSRPIPTEAVAGVTTDYFQYALLIRNGQPARPYP
jgi:hypothetical protein